MTGGAETGPGRPGENAAPREAGCRIVLIEDDSYLGAAVTLFLRERGHAVEHFLSSTAARAWLTWHGCDVVITDIFTAGDDGPEFVRWLRTKHRRVKLIAIGSRSAEGSEKLPAGEQESAVRVLAQPFELSQLAAHVDEMMERSR